MRSRAWTWVYGAAVALGVGTAALVAGQGVAHAESDSAPHASVGSAQHAAVGHSGRPSAMHSRRGGPTAGPAASVPLSVVVAHSRVAHPVAGASPAVSNTVTAPAPAESAHTEYGDVGKWMLRPDGQVANWLGQKYRCKEMYEPVNFVIIDPTSTTVAESTKKLNSGLKAAGFPAVPVHSGGLQGLIGGVTYGQQPTQPLQAFSDSDWLLPNNHGRVFGPAPGPGGIGYVWTASFSRERVGLYNLLPTHLYVSFNRARDAVRNGLVRTGATDLGLVALGNQLLTGTTTTGDHDGYAAVIMLA